VKKYRVLVTMYGGYDVEIEANNLEEAEDKAENMELSLWDVDSWDINLNVEEN